SSASRASMLILAPCRWHRRLVFSMRRLGCAVGRIVAGLVQLRACGRDQTRKERDGDIILMRATGDASMPDKEMVNIKTALAIKTVASSLESGGAGAHGAQPGEEERWFDDGFACTAVPIRSVELRVSPGSPQLRSVCTGGKDGHPG